MVQWRSTSHPRANWKPSGSNWSLGQATGHCAGMGTDVEAHRLWFGREWRGTGNR